MEVAAALKAGRAVLDEEHSWMTIEPNYAARVLGLTRARWQSRLSAAGCCSVIDGSEGRSLVDCPGARSWSSASAVASSAGRKITSCCASASEVSNTSRSQRRSPGSGVESCAAGVVGREVLVDPTAELRAGDRGEVGLEPFCAGDRGTEPQVERLLVRDVAPVGDVFLARGSVKT